MRSSFVLPIGFNVDVLPVGIRVSSPQGRDADVLAAARALESLKDCRPQPVVF